MPLHCLLRDKSKSDLKMQLNMLFKLTFNKKHFHWQIILLQSDLINCYKLKVLFFDKFKKITNIIKLFLKLQIKLLSICVNRNSVACVVDFSIANMINDFNVLV